MKIKVVDSKVLQQTCVFGLIGQRVFCFSWLSNSYIGSEVLSKLLYILKRALICFSLVGISSPIFRNFAQIMCWRNLLT